MSGNWKKFRVSQVCELIVDCINKTAPNVEYTTPYKMLRTPNIKGGIVSLFDCRHVEKETYENWTRRAEVLRGDVLLTREAPMGQVGIIDFDEKVFLGQRIMQYRANPQLLDPYFLLYSFMSPSLQNQFRMHEGSGSVVSHIRVPDCLQFELSLPSLEDQQKLSKILRDLDDKININVKINSTLEAMTQTIFKSWFVDFDPVKAKMDVLESGGNAQQAEREAMSIISGKDHAALAEMESQQSEAFAELTKTASLFPIAMVESELGLIPMGWEAKKFGQLLSHTIGGDWGIEEPDEKHTEEVKILRGTDLPEVHLGKDGKVPKRYVERKKLISRKLEAGDIVIEVSGGSPEQPTGRSLFITDEIISRFNCPLEPASFCRLFRPINQDIGLMLGIHLKKIYNDGKTWQYQNQSTGISNFQTTVFLEKEIVIVPSKEVLIAFHNNTCALLSKITSPQNNQLSAIRDALLPNLISGKISFPEFSRVESEVGS